MKKVSPGNAPRIRLAPISLAISLAWVAGTAFGQEVSGSIRVDGVLQGVPQSGTSIADSLSNTVTSASYIGDATTGVFNVRSGHSGVPGSTESSIIFSQTLTNSSSVAQNVSFSFYVFAGSISARAGLDTSGASFAASIDWSGSAVWNTRLDITNGLFYLSDQQNSTVSNSASAADFTYATTGDFDYVGSWDAYSKTLGLGILNPGESRTLTYTMTTVSYSGPDNYAGYGGSLGFAGDPLSFDTSPLPPNVVIGPTLSAAPVPEPSSYAMLGAGLIALAVTARRRTRRSGSNV